MAGARDNTFAEIISPFLRQKLAEAETRFGANSRECTALTRQYLTASEEQVIGANERRRHYESEVHVYYNNKPVVGVERLYRRTILIEPTTVCAAHCRWCLRGQYPIRTMKEDEISLAAKYIGSTDLRDDVDEVLITGGDPLMSQPLLALTLSELQRNAPNIRTVRIGSRVVFQDPRRINDAMMDIFARYPNFRFELGVNVNHPIEFWPETVEAIRRLQDGGMRIYNQHPLLRGVNDNIETLVELYDLLREHQIEAHYLFHAIPLRGMSHHRTSIRKGLNLATRLCSSGYFSGRTKPRFAVLSDIGKIVLYDGVIVKRREADNAVLLQSGYRLSDRQKWVPNWKPPASAEIDEDGLMRTWYVDAEDDE